MDFYKFICYLFQIMNLIVQDKEGKLVVNMSTSLGYLQLFEDLHWVYSGYRNPKWLQQIFNIENGFLYPC